MLICCSSKISFVKPNSESHLRLHRPKTKNGKLNNSGFTIIEILIVIILIGILSGAAVGTYSGVIKDTNERLIHDKLQTFFQSCKNRAKLRNLNIRITYNEQQKSFINQDSTNSFIRIPEIYQNSIPKLIEIDKTGSFKIDGKKINSLNMLLITPNGSLATITIRL